MWPGLCALALLAAAAAEETSGAGPFPLPRLVNVDQAQNHTVCPYHVREDHDPTRVPPRIRIRVCADEPLEECRTGALPAAACCDTHTAHHYFKCKELRETVVVQYRGQAERSTYEVPVGCACFVGEVHELSELPSVPSRRLALGIA